MAIALAMLILCFCPPESPTPRSPITVSYFSPSFIIKSWASAQTDASSTLSHSVASRFPVLILSVIVSENRKTSCITTVVWLLKRDSGSFRISMPSNRISPFVTS